MAWVFRGSHNSWVVSSSLTGGTDTNSPAIPVSTRESGAFVLLIVGDCITWLCCQFYRRVMPNSQIDLQSSCRVAVFPTVGFACHGAEIPEALPTLSAGAVAGRANVLRRRHLRWPLSLYHTPSNYHLVSNRDRNQTVIIGSGWSHGLGNNESPGTMAGAVVVLVAQL